MLIFDIIFLTLHIEYQKIKKLHKISANFSEKLFQIFFLKNQNSIKILLYQEDSYLLLFISFLFLFFREKLEEI